jgi:hypothetical protein
VSYALARRGTSGHVHAVKERRGVLSTACGRTLPATVHVWRSRALIRAVWLADDTRRCPACSREASRGW